MFVTHFAKKIINILKTLPWELLGLMLLGKILVGAAGTLGVLPVISIPLAAVFQAGIAMVFLRKYRDEKLQAEQLFEGFNNLLHVAGGMCWKLLWIFLWGLIPIVGPVFAVIKGYSYAFVPYILITRPELAPTEAVKESERLTEGYKGKMFLGHLAIIGLCLAVSLLSALLWLIPYVGPRSQ